MTLEKRPKSNRDYYYESRREGSRVIKKYVGSTSCPNVATIAEYQKLIAARNYQAKSRRKREREVATMVHQTLEQATLQGEELHRVHLALKKAVHRAYTEPEPFPELMPGDWGYEETREQDSCEADSRKSPFGFAELCTQVDSGNPHALQRYRDLISQHDELLSEMTDLVSLAKQQTIDAIAGESTVVREALRQQLERDTQSLVGEGSELPFLDRMLAELLLLNRMDALRCHIALSRQPENLSEVRFWTTASINAQRRFERALKRFRLRKPNR